MHHAQGRTEVLKQESVLPGELGFF